MHGTQAYVRPDGVRIASDYDHLTSGSALEMPIAIDEGGRTQGGTVWSATAPSGIREGASCFDWSSDEGAGAQGTITTTAGKWTEIVGDTSENIADCNMTDSRIYCFEK